MLNPTGDRPDQPKIIFPVLPVTLRKDTDALMCLHDPPRRAKKYRALNLRIDGETDAIWARIVAGLRTARRDAGHTQVWVAEGLAVRGAAIAEWETGSTDPRLDRLNRWCRRLDRRLVLVRPGSELRYKPVPGRDGEPWEVYERRRLASSLRNRRWCLGMTHQHLAGIVGVHPDSILRWETALVPPRPVSLIVWAQKLDYHLVLRPFDHGKALSGRERPPQLTDPVAIRLAHAGSPDGPERG